jgi:hypothetical protein
VWWCGATDATRERITVANSTSKQPTRAKEPWEEDDRTPPSQAIEEGTGGDVAPRNVQAGDVVSGQSPLQTLIDWCANEVFTRDESSSQAAMEDIVRQIMSGADAEEVLREQLPRSGRDFIDVPMLLVDYQIIESDFEDGEGFPFYASLRVMVGNPPEPKVINCGGVAVMAAIMRLVQLDDLRQFVVLRGKKNKAGRTPLRLVAAKD